MTTKFAAFFRLTFLYSAITSIFLLLILGGFCTDRLCTPFARDELCFALSLAFGFVGAVAIESGGQFKSLKIPTLASTFRILCPCHDIIGTWFSEVERFGKQPL